MKIHYRFFHSVLFFTLLLFGIKPATADVLTTDLAVTDAPSPETSFGVTCNGSPLLPGVPCVLRLEADALPDLQYAGMELRYDTERLAFVQVRPGSVFGEDAVVFAQHLPNGRLGVSVSSTAGEREGTGGIVYLDFVVADGAPHGTALFTADLLEITDRDGVGLSAPFPESAEITIPPYLTDAGITDPGPATIARGSELSFRFRLTASGITADDITGTGENGSDQNGSGSADGEDNNNGPDSADRLTAEMILIDANTWDGSAPLPDPLPFDRIVPLTFTGISGGQFRFEAPFPVEQAVGTWRVIARFQLDDHPVLTAGYSSGEGGLFDGEIFTAVPVNVTTPRVTVAEWSFDGEQWTADTGIFLNLQAGNRAELSLEGARFSGWTSGSSGRAPNSNNWQQENGDNGSGNDGNGNDNGNNGDNGDNGDGGQEGHGDGDGDDDGTNNGSENGSDNGGGDGSDSKNGGQDTGNGSPAVHDKYWQARLATTGYGELTLQFRMSGSGTGPRDFRLYYIVDPPDGDTDGSAGWQPVPDGEFQSSTSWSLNTITLPADAANAGELLLRWVRIGNTSISGNDIGPTGTNRIDEIRITGLPLDTDEMLVWPGSTNGSGTVTEVDVLSLGLYWMSTGPERVPRNISWAPQSVVRWTPASAAHADTDGDGRVDYRDLLAIGRNFGKTVDSEPVQRIIVEGHAKQYQGSTRSDGLTSRNSKTSENIQPAADQHAPLLVKTLPVLEQGETVRLVLRPGKPVSLTGLSTRFSLDLIQPDDWELKAFNPGEWADDWEADGRLIRFHYGRSNSTNSYSWKAGVSAMEWSSELAPTAGSGSGSGSESGSGSVSMAGSTWSAAWVHTGSVQPVDGEELAMVVIRAVTDWESAPQLRLHRVSLSTHKQVMDPDVGGWELIRQIEPADRGGDHRDELPQTTQLYSGYPNPFNPATTLSFDLHEPGPVRLSIYDTLGRRIATLIDNRLDAGRHKLTWDAAHMASGMYLVRLETGHTAQTRQVMLLK